MGSNSGQENRRSPAWVRRYTHTVIVLRDNAGRDVARTLQNHFDAKKTVAA